MRRSKGEEALLAQILLCGDIPPPVEEFRFAPPRQWRFDFVWLSLRLAVEVEGCTWGKGLDNKIKGRHNTGGGFSEDCVKYNEAALMGWTVLRFTTGQVTNGFALLTLRRALGCAALFSIQPVSDCAKLDETEPKR